MRVCYGPSVKFLCAVTAFYWHGCAAHIKYGRTVPLGHTGPQPAMPVAPGRACARSLLYAVGRSSNKLGCTIARDLQAAHPRKHHVARGKLTQHSVLHTALRKKSSMASQAAASKAGSQMAGSGVLDPFLALITDHGEIKRLFAEYKTAGLPEAKGRIVTELVCSLDAQAARSFARSELVATRLVATSAPTPATAGLPPPLDLLILVSRILLAPDTPAEHAYLAGGAVPARVVRAQAGGRGQAGT
jgi:hypothetical protein